MWYGFELALHPDEIVRAKAAFWLVGLRFTTMHSTLVVSRPMKEFAGQSEHRIA
jgi:hypothetical protein